MGILEDIVNGYLIESSKRAIEASTGKYPERLWLTKELWDELDDETKEAIKTATTIFWVS